jgi:multidrug efflux pump subunit AcrA (membrane-fusion protein)
LVVGLTVVAMGAAGTSVWLDRSGDAGAPPAVAAVAVSTGAVTVDIAAHGTIRAATTRSLGFPVDGTVAKVAVRAGSVVKRGAVLATLDSSGAAAAVNDARTALTAAQHQLDAAKAADSAAKTPAAAATTPEAAVRARVPARRAAAGAGAGWEATRAGSEASGPAGGAAGAVVGLRAGWAATGVARPAGGGGMDGGVVAAAVVGLDDRGARGTGAIAVRATVAPGPLFAVGVDPVFDAQVRVNQASADLAAARLALAGATITAPIGGTVMSVGGPVGSKVSAGATFVTLADTYAMQVSTAFPEADAGRLAVGQAATVTVTDRPGERFPARVLQVDPVGRPDGALVTYGTLLSFVRQPGDLLVGQGVAVQVRTDEVAATLRVPSTAVRDVRDGTGTVLVRTGRTAGSREVGVGLRGDQYTQITSGLAEGEMVERSG